MSAEVAARIERLDDLLIYCTGLGGLIPYALQALFGEFFTTIGTLPILLFVLIAPIYIGLYRGAIELDIIEERIRGWIYLIIGVLTSPCFLVLLWLKSTGYLTGLAYFILNTTLEFLLLFLGFSVGKRLHGVLCGILGINTSQERAGEIRRIIIYTSIASMCFSLYFSYASLALIQILSSKSNLLDALILLSIASLILVPIAIDCERKARKYVHHALKT